MERSGNGRRKVDRMVFDLEEIALSQIFEGMRTLNRRYERAMTIVVVALVFTYAAMGTFGYLLYHSGAIAHKQRVLARQELARGARTVAYDSCQRQNEHRAVERGILRRSVAGTRRFARAGLIPHDIEQQQLRELRRDVRALADADCARIARLIPLH